MIDDEQIVRLVGEIEFPAEPQMETVVGSYVLLGERRLRRRRMVIAAAGILGSVAAIATGIAIALPDDPATGVVEPSTREIARPSPQVTPSPLESPPTLPEVDELPFSATRQLLIDSAIEHFDPARSHMTAESGSFSGRGIGDKVEVGTKLGWTVPGESGEGMLYVAVTAPGYVAEEHALELFAGLGTDLQIAEFSQRELPGTGEQAWVAENVQTGAFGTLVIGVVYERGDGSLVGVGAYDMFGNNSLEPVSTIDVDLHRAAAFVTDPDLGIAAADRDAEVPGPTP